MSSRQRIGIIGGGIIGLACAWRLARDGCAVSLFDAAPEAREASWAAAGMLAPHHEQQTDGPLWRLGVDSLARWDGFVAALGVSTDAVDLRHADGLLPILTADDAHEAAAKLRFLAEAGIRCTRLTGSALHAAEPHLAPDVASALSIPAAQVNPRLVAAVLRDRCAQLGVDLRYGEAVTGLADTTVLLNRDHVACDHLVLASGAWTPALAALAGVALRGQPIKGQLLRFACADGLLTRFIHCRHAYLVPRQGQGVVVGATMAEAGFDRRDEPDAIAALATAASRLVPALAQAPIVETWTGLRPRLDHGLPVLATVRPGLTLATGHFRNGILLTPITADIITDLVLKRAPSRDLAPFAVPASSVLDRR